VSERIKIKRTFQFTWDRDLIEQVTHWMGENGYEKGDESAALKALVRLGLGGNPITAHLQDAKARAWSHCVRHFNDEMYGFLGQLRDQFQEAIKTTSPEEINGR
jgi:hypothetical protein